jgi:hypothetical protein
MSFEVMNQKIDIIQVFDGKKFWVSTNGKTEEIKDPKLIQEVRESARAEGGGNFVDMLNDKEMELSSVGTVKVRGKEAIGIRAAKKGQREVTYFFDKKTHLLVKTEQRALDTMSMQEYTQEKYMLEYADQDGMKVPRKIDIHKDGEPFVSIELTKVTATEKLDASYFQMP